MTPERAKKLLPVITAFVEGKEIEYLSTSGRWVSPVRLSDGNFHLDFEADLEWRIKPERRKVWVHFRPDGEVTVLDTEACGRACKVVCVEEPD